MRWNTFANILASLSIPFYTNLIPGSVTPIRKRRSRGISGRAIYFDALESRQLLSGLAPTITNISKPADQNSLFSFTLAEFTSAYNDSENDPLNSIQIVDLPARGTLTLTVSSVTSDVTASQIINSSDIAGLAYRPDNGSTGSDTFHWLASDGTSFSASSALVTLDVEKPVIAGISKNLFINHSQNFAGSEFTGVYTAVNPLLKATILTLPAHGVLFLGAAVTVNQVIDVGDLDSMVFVPTANYVGGDSFTWRASNGSSSSASGTVALTMATDLTDINRSTLVSTPLALAASDVTGAYTGPNSVLTVKVTQLPAHGQLKLSGTTVTTNQMIDISAMANLAYVPTSGFTGSDLFKWSALDGIGSSNIAQVNLTVSADLANSSHSTFANTPLAFAPSDITNAFTGSGTITLVTIATLPAHGTLKLTLNATTSNVTANQVIAVSDLTGLTFNPATDFTGNTSFTWSASVGTISSNTATVNIAVATPYTAFSKSMDKGQTLAFSAADFTGAFTGTIVSIKILRLPTFGSLKLTVGPSTTLVTLEQVIPVGQLNGLAYTPNASFIGSDSILWAASTDGNTFATPGSTIGLTTRALTVGDVSVNAGENTPFSFLSTDFSGHFTGGSELQNVKILTLPAHGALTLTNGTSSSAVTVNQIIPLSQLNNLVYTGANSFLGADSFKYTGADSGLFATPSATVKLNIIGLLIRGNNTTIENGDTTPALGDFTDFASTATVGPSVTRTYIVTNITNATINLTGGASLVQIAGGSGSEFIVTSPPASTLAPNASTSFTITFSPTHSSLRHETVTIPTSLPALAAFTFAVQGTGLAATNVVTTSTVGGLLSATTVAGTGVGAFNGAILHMTYTGRLLDGSVFDQTANHGNIPLAFRLDNTPGQSFLTGNTTNTFVNFPVIQGWEDGIQGMKVGEHRTLIIPAFFGYGDQGSGNTIPPGATLIFDITLNEIDGSPSLGITGSGQNAILPGDTTPIPDDGTDFGTLAGTQSSITHIFAGSNNSPDAIGGAPLGIIHQTGFSITGANPKDFTFSGSMTSFSITFKPNAPGVRTAKFNFMTDDTRHKTFSFTVKGNSNPFTDLIVKSVGTAAFPITTGTSGDLTTTVPVIIQNNGNGPVPSSTPTTDVRISLQDTTNTGNPPITLGTLPHLNIAGLGANATRTVNVPITIPNGLTLSTYVFIASINNSGAIAESIFGNDTLTINENLQGTLVSTTILPKIVDTDPVKGNVVVTVKNNGVLPFGTNQKVQIKIQAVDGSNVVTDIATGSSFSVASLKSGATANFTVPVNFIAGLTDGNYTLQAVLTLAPRGFETSITDNTVTTNSSGNSLTFESAIPGVDLTASFGTKQFGVSGGPTISTTLPVIVHNDGNIAVPNGSGSTDIHLFLHSVSAGADTSSDFEVGKVLHASLGGLKPTKTQEVDIPITVPGSLTLGDYVYRAEINNSLAITESDTLNNSSTASMNIGGTLISSTLPTQVPHTAKGVLGTVTVRLQNAGDLAIPSNMIVTVKISLHNVNSGVDTLLDPNARTITPNRWFAPGGFFDFGFICKIPTALPAGNYIIKAELVATPKLRESSAEDNVVTLTQFNSTIALQIT